MIPILVEGYTLPEAYHNALIALNEYGELADCADWGMSQVEIALTMVVMHPLQEPRISKLFIGGPKELEQYRMEMLDGILDFEIEKGKWDYTYHDRMANYHTLRKLTQEYKGRTNTLYLMKDINQIEFVIEELRRNPSSRRAVISIRDVRIDSESSDPACLQHIQYFIRNGALECSVLFRSNDACKATFMNAFALICLQEKIANELGVAVGKYVHHANSFHCYEKDFSMLEGYCTRIGNAKSADDLCFEYKDDWELDMIESRDEIMRQVQELKSH